MLARTLFVQLAGRAEGGTAVASELNTLALLLDAGDGCDQDRAAAMKFLEAAADCDHEVAQVTLAMLREEAGCETSSVWYKRAAALGNAQAQCWIAKRLLASGDYADGRRLMEEARDRGDAEAAVALCCFRKGPGHVLQARRPRQPWENQHYPAAPSARLEAATRQPPDLSHAVQCRGKTQTQ